LTEDSGAAGRILKEFGVTRGRLQAALKEVRGNQRVTPPNYEALERYGRDMTQLAAQGKRNPVIGRHEEIRRVIQVLSQLTKNNPVLVGEPGVGRKAIVQGLALCINRSDVAEGLRNKRVVELDTGALIAGARYRGGFEERFKAVLKEVQGSQGTIILFIGDLYKFVGAGRAEGAMDAGSLLKPLLSSGELQCIGIATPDEYQRQIETDASTVEDFERVEVNAPSVQDTITILRGLKDRYEVHHKVRIKDSALVAAAVLSDRYIRDLFLPAKAIGLVDKAAARLRTEVDYKPTELDMLIRRVEEFEFKCKSLRQENDPGAQERLVKLEKELANVKRKADDLQVQWRNEKDTMQRVRALHEAIKRVPSELHEAQRRGDWDQARELQDGKLPALENQLNAEKDRLAETHGGQRLLKEAVDEEYVQSCLREQFGQELISEGVGATKYNLSTIRALVQEAFGDQDLYTFCAKHFEPVADEFTAGQLKSARVELLVKHAKRHREIGKLLAALKLANHNVYAEYEPVLNAVSLPDAETLCQLTREHL
jgi:ATP-dependent Clp protease ATP-binding subunit ClpB